MGSRIMKVSHGLSIDPASGRERDVGENWLCLAGIAAIHGVVLATFVMGLGAPPLPVTPPAIMGVLVSDSRDDAKTAKSPKREPVMAETSKPRRLPAAHTHQAAPHMPPSARALTAAPAASVPSAAASASTDMMSGAKSDSGQVTQPLSDAAHLNNPKPEYPPVSRRIGEQGRVQLSVYILPDGRVGEIRVRQSSGYDRLDQAAIAAVRRWRYVPARRGDEPIPYWYVQPIVFSLKA